VKSYKSTAIRI